MRRQSIRWSLCVVACLLIAGGAFAEDSYSIFGTVTANTGKPVAGVTVDFGDKLASVTTDDAGYYEAEGAVEGAVYLLEPAARGWTFAPARRAVVMGSGDEQVDFTAEPLGGQLAGMLFSPPTPGASDQSRDKASSIHVDCPSAGTVWEQGGSYNIRWTRTAGYGDNPMRIRLYKGGSFRATVTNATPDDGSFWWKVLAKVQPGTDYMMRIDDSIESGYGGLFTVETAPLVTYPSDTCVCWRRGQGYQIRWQGFPGANVKLQLYRGSILSRGIAWSTPNDGSFWWSVPDDQRTADNYKIKVTAHSNSVNDMSDKPFAIVNNPRVTYPTYAGVVWEIGGSYNITWRQFVCDQVKLDLIRYGILERTITAATANDGSFHWQVPYDQTTTCGPALKVRVRAIGCPAQSDNSNNAFEMRRVPAVTYPTASGITWDAGSPYTIKWHGFSSANVKIELLKGWALDRVIKGWMTNDGLFKWWVPADLTPGTNYRIRVRGTSGSNQQDVSDSNFTVALVPLVTYPTASGIEWDIGDTVEIAWQGFEGTTVRIFLERWGGFSATIVYGTANNGSYTWQVPPGTDTGGGFKVKVRTQPQLVSDVSNQFFQINH